jgi:uncharacterized protein (DUF305 family)
MKRTVLAVTTATALLLAACGSSSNSDSPGMGGMPMHSGSASDTPGSGSHNTQDVQFATAMIPHDGQALLMADLALSRATNATVRRLAAAIKAAQLPENNTMSGWLTGWGSPVPATHMSPGMAGMSMPGMMSGAAMAALRDATGRAFDRLWLRQMIMHHRGAVTMARTELVGGRSPAVTALARSIIASQSREIATMTRLLAAMSLGTASTQHAAPVTAPRSI